MTDSEQLSDTITDKSPNQASQISQRKQLLAQVEELEQQAGVLTAEIETERDKRLRVTAEYDNYRRRTSKEYLHLAETASERILSKLLPVLDDFDRMMAHSDADATSLKQGTEMIYRKLQGFFESEGVVAIPSVGASFDAGLHEAVAQVSIANCESGAIIAEVERGYRLREKIIRHAKVIVAQAIDQTTTTEEDQNG